MSVDLVMIVLAVVAGLAWLFRLEGRLSTHEAVCSERYTHIVQTLADIRGDVAKLVDEDHDRYDHDRR